MESHFKLQRPKKVAQAFITPHSHQDDQFQIRPAGSGHLQQLQKQGFLHFWRHHSEHHLVVLALISQTGSFRINWGSNNPKHSEAIWSLPCLKCGHMLDISTVHPIPCTPVWEGKLPFCPWGTPSAGKQREVWGAPRGQDQVIGRQSVMEMESINFCAVLCRHGWCQAGECVCVCVCTPLCSWPFHGHSGPNFGPEGG